MSIEEKQCSKCSEVKPLDCFHVHNGFVDGRNSCCKACHSVRAKAYREQNRDAERARCKSYYWKHRAEAPAKTKAYREKNKEALRIKKKAYAEQHKEYKATYDKAYREKNREALRAGSKAYYKKNKERQAAYGKAYRQERKQVIAARKREDRKRRMKIDPGYKARMRLGTRLYQALKYQGATKTATTMNLVGCSKAELMLHTQNQFRPGMAWNNYGPVWHVDHIRPCACFDLSDREQQKACFHWSNLQPLFGPENRAKGAKYDKVAK